MFFPILLVIVFACQIVVVSLYFPRKLASAAQDIPPRRSGEQQRHRFPTNLYATLNNVVAVVGLLVLMLCLTLQSRDVMTGLLLCIGLFFLLQISTIAIPLLRGALPVQRPAPYLDDSVLDSTIQIRLFHILPLVPVIIAAGLYVAYVFVICTRWDQFESNQISKLVSVTLTNLLLACTVLWAYGRFKKGSAEKAVERYRELTRMAPTMVFGSILVTVYFFIKEIMFGLDLHELRPIMMSVFLQLIAIAVFRAVFHVDKSNSTVE